MTLKDILDRNRGIAPGFHMLRHLLAFTILAHHCRVAVFGVHYDSSYEKGAAVSSAFLARLSGGELIVELFRPGLYALVGMFFALSGFLIAGSALREARIGTFFAARAFRILPALSVEISLSALVLGPLVTTMPLSHYFSNWRFFRYFGNIVGEISYQLPGVFLGNPWPKVVNANLWTLPAEFWCYFLVLFMMWTGLIVQHRRISMIVLATIVLAACLSLYDPVTFSVRSDSTRFAVWYIVVMFFLGVVFFLNARWIPYHPAIFLISGASYYAMTLFDLMGPVSGLFLMYCTAFIGATPFPIFDKILKQDLSYGIYLYGFPITQALVHYLGPALLGFGPAVRFGFIFPIVFSVTTLFSLVSWIYIEKPALQLRKRFLRGPVRANSVDSRASAFSAVGILRGRQIGCASRGVGDP